MDKKRQEYIKKANLIYTEDLNKKLQKDGKRGTLMIKSVVMSSFFFSCQSH